MKKVAAEIAQLEYKLANQSFSSDVEVEFEGHSARQKVSLKWSYEIEARTWGIKGISVHVPEQQLTVNIEETNEDGDDIEMPQPIKISNPKIEYTGSGEHGLALYPVKVEVWKGKVTVEFHRG